MHHHYLHLESVIGSTSDWSERTPDTVRIPIASDRDISTAREKGRAMAAQMGFSATESAFVASAISELGRNIVSYAHQGTVTLKAVHRLGRSQLGILILAKDQGPGILNTALASRGGFSTSGGMGLGLAGVRRLMDEFEIVSQLGKGTTVIAKKWLHKATRLRRGHNAQSI